MKKKKTKNYGQLMRIQYSIEEQTRKALDNALLYVLALKDFDFSENKINEECASNAEEKVFSNEIDLTPGELRACYRSVRYVLENFPASFEGLEYIEEEFPNLLHDLQRGLALLKPLQEVFQSTVNNVLNKR